MRTAAIGSLSSAVLCLSGLAGAQQPPPPLPSAYATPASPPPAPPALPSDPEPDDSRRPWEIALSLGFGNAVCDNEQPTSDCPVDGGGALSLGGAYRFHPHWAAGLELGVWAFEVRDEWQGQLQDKATEVTFGSVYLSPMARWYWFDSGPVDPYLQAGVGIGAVSATAKNATGEYEYTARGVAYSLGIGADWKLSRLFRLGPQFLAYLHVSSALCEKSTGVSESCRSPGTDENGGKEGLALPWRVVVVGTFTLGDP